MEADVALLLTDLVDSAALAQRLGDAEMGRVWATHDRIARDLLRHWQGREIDKTDGFLLLFEAAGNALGYALDYHRALALMTPPLQARAGLHVGALTLRETPQADVALGAKPLEVDGLSKPVAARVMATALGGQTLLTRAAIDALGPGPQRRVCHGHWRVKGLPAPIELFEIGDDAAPFTPPPDTEKVYRVVARGEIWLPLREVPHNLPAERDAFIGRRSNLQDLVRRFDGGARLVSVLGIGGCGKTRLATHFGWAWMGDYPGGVWFCDLAPAREIDGLCSAVAQGLAVPLGQADPLLQIGNVIAGRGRCLLILDNFEQLSRHAEATLGRWLDRAAEATFLVTTREVLGIAGEEALALAPMPAAEGEALFLRRASAARHDFEPSAEDLAAVGPLVKLLDGLPLAIELAAARARTLTPRALLARMSERFRLLASSGGRHDRQATLRAAFDWSWDLLSPAEKMTLAQLSVFESGFTLDAAEGVIDLSGMPGAPWALDLLNSLVDKSFVRPCGESRFDLLVSVQAYADEHLRSEGRYAGSGPAALQAARLRHAVWFADRGPKEAVQHACADMDNLVVAVRRAVAAAHAPAAIGALEGAWAALNLRGPFSLAVELGEQVTKLPAVREGRSGRPHVVLAEAYRAMGQHAAATALYRTALERARASDDHRCQVVASLALGQQHSRQGLTEQALQELQHGLQWARQLQDVDLVAQALNFLGNSAFERGEMALAQTHYEAALDSARQAGDLRLQGSLLGNLGTLHGAQGRVDLARRHCEEALAINRQLGDLQREGERLSNLGMICHMQGEQDEALAHTRSALQVARSLGHSRLECVALANIGLIQQTLGLWPDAATHTTSALALSETHADAQLRHQILTQLAGIRGQQARDAWLKGEEAGFTAFRQAAGAAVSAMSVAPDAELQAQLRQLDADANRADASAQAAEGLPFVPPFAPA